MSDTAILAERGLAVLQFGWILKGLVYAIIGGVACQAAAQDKQKINDADISPQVSLCTY